MNIKKVIVGNLQTNCYILENDKECLIIDPGDEFDKIKNNIQKNVVGILLTHRHFDHIGALKELVEFYKVDVHNRSNLKEGNHKINDFEFEVFYNPGHTDDSISFIFNNVMFSVDFIILGTIGRWDLGGNITDMKNSIIKILNSKINYKIYPGHGDITYIIDERKMLEYYLK